MLNAPVPAEERGRQIRLLARSRRRERGRACPLCPISSDVDLFCYCKRIVDFNSQVPDGAFDFGVPQKQLYSSQITSAPIDEGRLRPAERMGPEQVRIQAYPAIHPDKSRAYCRVVRLPPVPRRPVNRLSPGFLPVALR